MASPLHDAARTGDIEAIERLLRDGADIDELDRNGNSARYIASEAGHNAAEAFLKEKGARTTSVVLTVRTDDEIKPALKELTQLIRRVLHSERIDYRNLGTTRNYVSVRPVSQKGYAHMTRILKERGKEELEVRLSEGGHIMVRPSQQYRTRLRNAAERGTLTRLRARLECLEMGRGPANLAVVGHRPLQIEIRFRESTERHRHDSFCNHQRAPQIRIYSSAGPAPRAAIRQGSDLLKFADFAVRPYRRTRWRVGEIITSESRITKVEIIPRLRGPRVRVHFDPIGRMQLAAFAKISLRKQIAVVFNWSIVAVIPMSSVADDGTISFPFAGSLEDARRFSAYLIPWSSAKITIVKER